MTNSNDLARRVAALLSSPRFRPLPERELAKTLHLDPASGDCCAKPSAICKAKGKPRL